MMPNTFRALLISFLLTCIIRTDVGAAPPVGEGYITAPDGVHLFYKVVGTGSDVLVVLHGGPGNTMHSILPDLEPLAKEYTIIYYDQRGNGNSDLIDDDALLSIEKHVEDLEAIRIHFNLDRFLLLGNSWGGLLASYYAIAHPDRVARLILHSPASPTYDLLRDSTPFIYQRIPRESMARFYSMSVPMVWLTSRDPLGLCRSFYDLLTPVYFSKISRAEQMKGNVCAGPLDAVRRQPSVNKMIWESLGEWDLIKDLGSLNVPTLVIHGSYDMIPVDSSIAWVESLPNARLLVIQDSGHMTHIERPDIFFPAVRTFLAGGWPEDAIEITGDEEGLPQPRIDTFRP